MQNPLLFETTKTSSILTHQIPSTLNPISSIRFDYRTSSSVILFLQHKAHVPIHLCKWLTESISLIGSRQYVVHPGRWIVVQVLRLMIRLPYIRFCWLGQIHLPTLGNQL